MARWKIGNKDPTKKVIKKLSPSGLRKLLTNLPTPATRYFSLNEGVVFELYKAKSFNDRWRNKTLWRLVIEARGSYYRYGDYPPLDKYDKRAVVYLVRAIYLDKIMRSRAEEWLSLRFVPGGEKSGGLEDLESYIYNNRLAEDWVKTKLFGGDNNFLKYIISISRLCGIESFLSPRSSSKESDDAHKRDNRFTPICFAILCQAVIKECAKKKKLVKYFTAQIPEELVEGFLAFKKGDKKYVPSFDLASDVLNIKDKENLKLDRSKYAYKFPLYFLKMKDLIWFIRMLLTENLVSEEVIVSYLKNKEAIKDIKEKDYISAGKLKGLGSFLTVKGFIKNSQLTGEKLRELAKVIGDGPDLRIMEFKKWKKSIEKILEESETLDLDR